MFIKINDITKGTFRLPTPIDNRDRHLQIGIKSIGYWVGFYNIYEEQICRWGSQRENSKEFKIKPGLYTFKELSRTLRKKVQGLNITLDKTTGLIDLSIPENVDVWLTEPIRYVLGLNEDKWFERPGETGDRPVEFLPAGGISIYLDELSTSNLSTKQDNLVNSNLLGDIPMLSENFGQYYSIQYDKPKFLNLTAGEIHQLEFSLKINWGNNVEHVLDNHSMPISLELEIK